MSEKVTTLEELNDILDKNERVVIDLGAPSWCIPCRRLSPHFNKASEKSSAVFVEIDIENCDNAINESYPVQTVPTVLYIRKGYETVTLNSRTSVQILKEIGE